MKKHTLIFLGPSGCGKGTQVELVKKYLSEKDSETPIAHLVMGDLFRAMWKKEGYSFDLSKEIMIEGGLQPSFMQVKLWSQFFVDNVHGNEHIIIDGSPRRVTDAELMESAFDFYGREKPTLVFINCDIAESKERIIKRAEKEGRREDLKEETIDSRMEWYKEHVVPSIDFFRNKDKYNFAEIDGNGTIEEVFAEIKQKVFNDNND